MFKFELPNGTRDLLPSDVATMNRARESFIRSAEIYGFQEIQTPIFEHVEVFSARSGPAVKDSMLTFYCDHEEYALRPEMTAPVCRLMSSGALEQTKLPHKILYFGPCFRYTRAHSGQYREFLQAGIECLGATGTEIDAEVIAASVSVLRSLGVEDFSLRIGNVGIFRHLMPENMDIEDRTTIIGHLDKLNAIHEKCLLASTQPDNVVLDELHVERMELARLQEQTNYVGPYAIVDKPQLEPDEYHARLGDEAEATFKRLWEIEEMISSETAEVLIRTSRLRGPVQTVRKAAVELLENTQATDALSELFSLCDTIEMYGIRDFEVVLGIARGFTFYTSSVFEIVSRGSDRPTLYCGGGRYDRLVELFGGPSVPSVGCAFRFDALAEALHWHDAAAAAKPHQCFLLAESRETLQGVIHFAESLRREGLRVGVSTAKPEDCKDNLLENYKTETIVKITDENSLQLIDCSGTHTLPLNTADVVSHLARNIS